MTEKVKKSIAKGRPIAYKFQRVIIPLFPLSFLLIMQKASITVYKFGIILLITTAMLQNIFGNIDGNADIKETVKGFIRNGLIIVAVFTIGIFIVPYLVNLGRG